MLSNNHNLKANHLQAARSNANLNSLAKGRRLPYMNSARASIWYAIQD